MRKLLVWYRQAMITLRRVRRILRDIEDHDLRLIELEQEVSCLEADKVHVTDMWDVEDRLDNIEAKIEE